MRILLVILIVCIIAFRADAQDSLRYHYLEASRPLSGAAKTTGRLPRLRTTAYFRADSFRNLVIVDSTLYSYRDSSGELPDTIVVSTMRSGHWGPQSRYSYRFNSFGKIIEENSDFFPVGGPAWVNFFNSQYTVNDADTPSQILVQSWDQVAGKHVDWQLRRYTTNPDGKVTDHVLQTWNAGSGNWLNTNRFTYAYNAQGSQTRFTSQLWNAATGAWKNNVRLDYDYATDGKTAQYMTQYVGNLQSGNWDSAYQATFFNNPVYGNNDSTVVWTLTPGYGRTGSNRLERFWYDNSGHLVRQTADSRNNYRQVGKILDYSYAWNSDGQMASYYFQEWATQPGLFGESDTVQKFFTYEADSGMLASGPQSGMRMILSPVPASEELTITLATDQPQRATIALVSLTGQNTKEISVQAGKRTLVKMSTANMPAGDYLLRATGSTGARQTQLVSIRH